ncbi:MAG: hypothetical protein ACRC5M_04940 [Anaeroplasmataceae bacterium]
MVTRVDSDILLDQAEAKLEARIPQVKNEKLSKIRIEAHYKIKIKGWEDNVIEYVTNKVFKDPNAKNSIIRSEILSNIKGDRIEYHFCLCDNKRKIKKTIKAAIKEVGSKQKIKTTYSLTIR